MIYLIVIFTILSLLLWPYRTLLPNYLTARKLHLPILITPIRAGSVLHSLLGNFGGLHSQYLRRIPFLFNYLNYTGFEFLWSNGLSLHQEHGPAYIVVSPGEINLVISDPEAVKDIFLRRKDFLKGSFGWLNLFGENVFTLDGKNWERHRRLTTTPFTERISESVWKQSLIQARSMLHTWTSAGKKGVSTTSTDTTTLALHVLSSVAFGKSYAFEAGVQNVPEGHEMSYRECLRLLIGNVSASLIVANVSLSEFLLPKLWIDVKQAVAEYRKYMTEILHEERDLGEKEKTDNLVGAFSRASGAEKEREMLSDNEISGNLFVYTLGGHDTTASTLVFAILLLAIHPEWQEWLREEIRTAFGTEGEVENWDYVKGFSRRNRCLAVMYETLRLFGPAPATPRRTHLDAGTTLRIQGKEYILPPKTVITIDISTVGTDPESWGSDTMTWRPDRFIARNGPSIEQEEFLPPRSGTFQHWSSGPRVCPGKKFSQVEFVAVISCLLQNHRAVPIKQGGESDDEARKRIDDIIHDAAVFGPTLKMRNPEKVQVAWEQVK